MLKVDLRIFDTYSDTFDKIIHMNIDERLFYSRFKFKYLVKYLNDEIAKLNVGLVAFNHFYIYQRRKRIPSLEDQIETKYDFTAIYYKEFEYCITVKIIKFDTRENDDYTPYVGNNFFIKLYGNYKVVTYHDLRCNVEQLFNAKNLIYVGFYIPERLLTHDLLPTSYKVSPITDNFTIDETLVLIYHDAETLYKFKQTTV